MFLTVNGFTHSKCYGGRLAAEQGAQNYGKMVTKMCV